MSIEQSHARSIAILWLALTAWLVIVFLSMFIIMPNAPGISKLTALGWSFSTLCAEITLAPTVYLTKIMMDIAFKNKKMERTQYEFIKITALVWFLALVILETMAESYHISKFAVAAFWLINWGSAYIIYDYDSFP